jgi:hypothetical protein
MSGMHLASSRRMQTARRWLTGLGLATTLVMSGCLCGADEVHAVTVSAPDSLVVVANDATRKIEVVTRLTENEASPAAFRFVYNTIEGSAGGEGVALTLSGLDPATNETVLLVLALPVSLRRGEEYQVGGTFTVDAGFGVAPRAWGPYDLQQPNRAEAAFTTAAYQFPPGRYDTTFRAATSTGTVRITNRRDGWLEMALDLRFTDATGRTRTVTGRAQANSESYAPPCT